MSFSRYSLEKKQISTDRGVTWQDVTPSETRYGQLMAVTRTLLECEDMACDHEKYEYYLVDGILPDEICANMIKTIPFGIVSSITFTDGAYCCSTWSDAGSTVINLFGDEIRQATGIRRCSGNYCPGWGYYYDVGMYGFEMHLGSMEVCGLEINTCIRINSFMPWAEGKETWKLIYRQHYTREHCSDEWEADGEAESVAIGERWIRESEDFNNEYWRHQIASEFDESGNVVTWTNAELDTRQMTDYELPSEIELIDYIKNDGVACATMIGYYLNPILLPTKFHSDIAIDGSLTPSGVTYTSMYMPINNRDWVHKDYRVEYHDDYVEAGYYIDWYLANPTSYQDIEQKLSGDFERITYSGNTSVQRLFAYLWYTWDQNYNIQISEPSSIAYGLKHKKLYNTGNPNIDNSEEKHDCTTIAFPYRIRENRGQQDDYYNSSEIGYILRDGRKIILRTFT